MLSAMCLANTWHNRRNEYINQAPGQPGQTSCRLFVRPADVKLVRESGVSSRAEPRLSIPCSDS